MNTLKEPITAANELNSGGDTIRQAPLQHNSIIIITGSSEIDQTINDVCPHLRFFRESEIKNIGNIITDHILGRRMATQEIIDRTNVDTFDIIEGFAIIAATEGITSIIEIQNHIQKIIGKMDANDICGI